MHGLETLVISLLVLAAVGIAWLAGYAVYRLYKGQR